MRDFREFICAAHYFGRASMGNFWSTFEAAAVPSDFALLRSDGFNTVILIVPWAEFQPRIDPVEYDPVIFDRLGYLLTHAERAGLRVILRLGYTWEFAPVRMSTYARYRALNHNDKVRAAWKSYLVAVRDFAERMCSRVSYLLTWEDPYWPLLRGSKGATLEVRREFARQQGFHAYLSDKYGEIDLLNKLHEVNYENFAHVPAPAINEPLFSDFVLFFDQFLDRWLALTAAVLERPVGYEHRIDPDVTVSANRRESVEYSFFKTGCAWDSVYYHPKIGTIGLPPQGIEKAYQHLVDFVRSFRRNSIHKRPLFLDQFNFKIDNPKHPDFKRLTDAEIPEFLERCAELFKGELIGYGVWGWRDWRDDKLYNGAFELGLAGWVASACELRDLDGRRSVLMPMGARIEQRVNTVIPAPQLYLECAADVSALVEVGNEVEQVALEIIGPTRVIHRLQRPGQTCFISVIKGELLLSKVAYFSHQFTNGLRSVDGESNQAVDAISRLNRELAAPPASADGNSRSVRPLATRQDH